MDSIELNEIIENCIWVAKQLWIRNKVTGSSSNLSFKYKDRIFITKSGSSFGNLSYDDFSELDLEGRVINDIKPSKELPLHLVYYKNFDGINAVLHTHSFYSTLWSVYNKKNSSKIIPKYTPYLEMKLGEVGIIEYAKPGSEELFGLFKREFDNKKAYLMKNHGVIIGEKNIIEAFNGLEELEESCKLAWKLRNYNLDEIG